MTQIQTLVTDIYDLVQNKKETISIEALSGLSKTIETRLITQFHDTGRKGTLRLSRMGLRCPCALWYEVNHPEMAEQLPPWATIKYTYGHILEAMAICLAKAAGHSVTGEGDELIVDGIKGHRDCVVDGCIVDVKSSSSMGFNKFKDGSIKDNDQFGYLDQLDGYMVGSYDDPLVLVKDKAYILAIDKQLGHMVLYEHKLREDSIRERIMVYRGIVERSDPPDCTCKAIPDGKSGNIRLDTKASYSAYKYCCNPRIRTFLYADGPRYLTHVERKPDVMEIDKDGRIVYN